MGKIRGIRVTSAAGGVMHLYVDCVWTILNRSGLRMDYFEPQWTAYGLF